MGEPIGCTIPFSPGRRIICDFLRVSMNLPAVVIQKTVSIPELAAARQTANPRPSWSSIFTKAYGIVVSRRPDLRCAFLSFPWERLFQSTATSVDIVVESQVAGDSVLLLLPIKSPESCELAQIDQAMAAGKDDPGQVREFRRALGLARCPAWIRRAVWWYLLNVSGRRRSRYFGAFGVSSVGGFGCDLLTPIAPWSTLLHCGAVDAQGTVTLRLTFDHRILDGSGAAKALNELEQVLKTEMLAAFRTLPAKSLAA